MEHICSHSNPVKCVDDYGEAEWECGKCRNRNATQIASCNCSQYESFTPEPMVQNSNGYASLQNYYPNTYMTVTPGHWRSKGQYSIEF
jgi:hypothetical protein